MIRPVLAQLPQLGAVSKSEPILLHLGKRDFPLRFGFGRPSFPFFVAISKRLEVQTSLAVPMENQDFCQQLGRLG